MAVAADSDRVRPRQSGEGAVVVVIPTLNEEASIGAGVRQVPRAGAAQDADVLVFMDGDGADDPKHIADLVELIRAGRCDFVIGSRARGEREPGSIAWHQLAAGRLAG